jgi:Major tropism determinant N-terminal domain
MAVQLQWRRDTAANWASANPTLAQGEAGLETDTGKVKLGNGSTAWASLAYAFALATHAHGAGDITSGTLDGDRLPAMSATKKGGVPATGTPAAKYLRDDGAFAKPAESELTLNYATHSNANDPSASEKAALAGTSGTPGAGNAYVTDGDARNTNARTPTAHKTSHQGGGADEISVAGLSGELADPQPPKVDGLAAVTDLADADELLAYVAGVTANRKITWANVWAKIKGLVGINASDRYTKSIELAEPSSDGGFAGITGLGTCGETLAVGDLVYYKAADSRWWKAKADAAAMVAGVELAIALAAGSAGDSRLLLRWGLVKVNTWSWTVAKELVVSTATAGAMAESATGVNNYVRSCGYARAATIVMFKPANTYIKRAA